MRLPGRFSGLARGRPPGLLTAGLAWLAMLCLAILNGILRDLVYARYLSELQAHQVSTLLAIILFGGLIRAYMLRYPARSLRQVLLLGGAWTLAVLAFEFLFFHFVAGHSWSALIAAYDLTDGRVWGLLVLWVGAAPLIFYRLNRTGVTP